MDEFEIVFTLISVQTVLVLGLVIISIILGRKIVSKTAELTAAVSELTQAVQNAIEHSASVTPDQDVQASIDAVNAAKDQLNAAFPVRAT